MRDLLGGSTKLERCKTSKNNSTVHCVNPPKASTDGDFSDHGGLLHSARNLRNLEIFLQLLRFTVFHFWTFCLLKDSRYLDKVFRVSCGEDRHSPVPKEILYCIFDIHETACSREFLWLSYKVSLCIQVLPLGYLHTHICLWAVYGSIFQR